MSAAKKHLLRFAEAEWSGSLSEGSGNLSLQSQTLAQSPFSFESRFENENGDSDTNPEELLAAAHAACYSMQLSHFLAQAGHPPQKVETKCEIRLDKKTDGYEISSSMLVVSAFVPGMDKEEVLEWAEKAKNDCPLSKALSSVKIGLELHVPNA